jgi:hypothetical protein
VECLRVCGKRLAPGHGFGLGNCASKNKTQLPIPIVLFIIRAEDFYRNEKQTALLVSAVPFQKPT